MIQRDMCLSSGEVIEVLSPGILNLDAGPDFYNARVRIGGVEWIGNVEIHVKASDWYRHNHHEDSVYDSVILHVVAIDDRKVFRSDGSVISQLVLTFPEQFFSLYELLSREIADVKCAPWLRFVPELVLESWFETLSVERMQQKSRRILEITDRLNGDWETATFISFARALGFGLNSEPFEMLARSIPLNYLMRHSDNLLQIEALLFGQAGMLDTSIHIFDEYYQTLCREYFFLARKYNLWPMRRDLWKYARTRPQNFPHRRIALLASALYGGFNLKSKLWETKGDISQIEKLFDWRLEGYWLNHFDFDREGVCGGTVLGKGSIYLLAINFAAPMIYSMAQAQGDPDAAEYALDLWSGLPAEENRFIANWKSKGVDCHNAFRSQALLQLRKEYCDRTKCLDCRIGNWLLRDRINHTSHQIGFSCI